MTLLFRSAAILYFLLCCQASAIFQVNSNSIELSILPGFDHAPLTIDYSTTAAPAGPVTATSDAAWVQSSVETGEKIRFTFDTKDLVSSNTATITLSDGSSSLQIFIHANVYLLDVRRLEDDPLRSRTYGLQDTNENEGAFFWVDPINETLGQSLTVGTQSSDFFISRDSSQAVIINSLSKTLSVIDLNSFSVVEEIILPSYDSWGNFSDPPRANVAEGPNGLIYYIDGSWGPRLRVFDPSTSTVLQTIDFAGDAVANDTGFADIAVSPDLSKIFARAQYGWSAGSGAASISIFTIEPDGTLTATDQTSTGAEYPSWGRDPYEAPIFISSDGDKYITKTVAVSPNDVTRALRTFSSNIWAITPHAELVSTVAGIFSYHTGELLYDLGGSETNSDDFVSAQAFTSDYSKFVHFDTSDKTIKFVDLVAEIGLSAIGVNLTPAHQAFVTTPSSLDWAPFAGIDLYNVYLGTDLNAVSSATPTSPSYLGQVSGNSIGISTANIPGQTYYWRVDPVSSFGPQAGNIYQFTVSSIALTENSFTTHTVLGDANHLLSLGLSTPAAPEIWSVSSSESWISFTANSGTTPSTIEILIDSTLAGTGLHSGSITISTSSGDLSVPIDLSVDSLNLTHIRSARDSSTFYAISETDSAISSAYLLEIDSLSEKIIRSVPCGDNVTDLAIHYPDAKLYVANWGNGSLLEFDRSTLNLERTLPFQPSGATGYAENDVYRVSAGSTGRILVEEEDQWIDISIYDTPSHTEIKTINVREGGGEYDPTGRYYYHGENNSSGAEIFKFDVTGDVFTELAAVRPSGISYYGSRTVIVSEDGSRIFWANVLFDDNLADLWDMGETVYSCSADGSLAFANDAIYNTNTRTHIFDMPVTTTVSGHNSTTEKLLVQEDGELAFYFVNTSAPLPSPVFTDSQIFGTDISLFWSDKSLESGFQLQFKKSSDTVWTDLVSTASNITNHLASSLDVLTSYDFRVRAMSASLSSNWSPVLSLSTSQPPPPTPAISSINSPSGTGSAQLNLAISGNPDLIIVERKLSSEEIWSEIDSFQYTGATTYFDLTTQQNTSYTYRIISELNNIRSQASTERTVLIATVQPPTTPSISSFFVTSPTSLGISWSSEANAVNYELQKEDAAGLWQTIYLGSSTDFTDQSLLEQTTYAYRVRGLNSFFEGLWSPITSGTTTAFPPPTTPTSVMASTQSITSIKVTWADGPDEESFQVFRSRNREPFAMVASLPTNTTEFLDSNLIPDSLYQYYIISSNPIGDSPPSETAETLTTPSSCVLEDNFNTTARIDVWNTIENGSYNDSLSGLLGSGVLYFSGNGTRQITSHAVDLSQGGRIQMKIRGGDGSTGWNTTESGEHVVLEYSTNGTTWLNISSIYTDTAEFETWQSIDVALPVGTLSANTVIRIRQLSHSDGENDTWAIEDFCLFAGEAVSLFSPAGIVLHEPYIGPEGQVQFSWIAQPTLGAPVLSLTLQKKSNSQPWITHADITSSEQFIDEISTVGTSYDYRLIATNSEGSTISNTQTIQIPQYLRQLETDFTQMSQLPASWQIRNYNGQIAPVFDNGLNLQSGNSLYLPPISSWTKTYLKIRLPNDNFGLPLEIFTGEYITVTPEFSTPVTADETIHYYLLSRPYDILPHYITVTTYSSAVIKDLSILSLSPPPPSKVNYFTTTASSSDSVSLFWLEGIREAADFAESYQILRFNAATNAWIEIATVADSDVFKGDFHYYTDNNLNPNTSYSYSIVAMNKGGSAEPSNISTVRTDAEETSPLLTWLNTNYGIDTIDEVQLLTRGSSGVSLLDRYAYNINPAIEPSYVTSSSQGGMPSFYFDRTIGKLKGQFIRRKSSLTNSISYHVMCSENLDGPWIETGTLSSPVSLAGDFEIVEWIDMDHPVGPPQKRFVKLEVRLIQGAP